MIQKPISCFPTSVLCDYIFQSQPSSGLYFCFGFSAKKYANCTSAPTSLLPHPQPSNLPPCPVFSPTNFAPITLLFSLFTILFRPVYELRNSVMEYHFRYVRFFFAKTAESPQLYINSYRPIQSASHTKAFFRTLTTQRHRRSEHISALP